MKYTTIKLMAALLITLPVCFSACVKDNCKQKYSYSWYVPVYMSLDEVKANVKSNKPRKVENPGKIFIKDNYIFLNEVDRGVHIIDNANPRAPINVAFINIPGNLDIAVKGNTLYADLYSDLLAIDISNPKQVKLKNYLNNVFPYRSYGTGGPALNGNQVITDWIKKDTTVTGSCEGNNIWDMRYLLSSGAPVFYQASAANPASSVSPVGKSAGGSMARFTIVNDRMYTVSTSSLNVFNISAPENPVKGSEIDLSWNIETIYPFGKNLFIGSQTGMFIYDISNPDAPQAVGQFTHARSCDPVIAENDYAYVTLSTGNFCQGTTNQLDIVRLNSLVNPTLVKSYQLTSPQGLSKDGNTLFVCDGRAGVKVYDATISDNIRLVKEISSFDAYDVIAFNKIALIVGKNGLYQYSYDGPANIKMLSKIPVEIF